MSLRTAVDEEREPMRAHRAPRIRKSRSSAQSIEQSLGIPKVGGIESLGEPVIAKVAASYSLILLFGAPEGASELAIHLSCYLVDIGPCRPENPSLEQIRGYALALSQRSRRT